MPFTFKSLAAQITLIALGFVIFTTLISAVSESDCLNKSVGELSQSEMDECINTVLPRMAAAYAPAQEKNKAQLASLKKQISDLISRINSLSVQLKNTESSIKEREDDLAFAKEIFEEKAVSQYKRSRLYDPITPFLFSDSALNAFREISFRQRASDEDRKTMEEYANDLLKLKTDRENLEKNKISLAALQKKVAEDAKFLEAEVGKVESFLAVLSSKQQEILNAKSGSFIASVGDSDLADDYNASIKGFRESAPSGSFTVFSFGAYTHRKGMSQYGARGRAQNGKNYDEILRAYYSFDGYEDRGGITIKVNNGDGVNKGGVIWSGSLEDYVKRIYEVPDGWPAASLQAQAVAARSYVLAVTGSGAGSICANQYCQVFKTEPKGGNWENAVAATSGKVMVSGGQPISAYYSSTSGGYLSTMGWDTTDGGGGSNFLDKTYEKLGGSPWVYKAWYRQGYTSSGATCGRSNPWLSNEEFTDIVNAALVLRSGSDSRITPITTSCWGGNPYSFSELREKGGVNSVTSVSVSQGNGVTNNVVVNGISFTGAEFKQAFNLRAPGYLMIPQKGFAFFNIEKK